MRQAALNPDIQKQVCEIAARQYPDVAGKYELPLIIALPFGIHPYNRAGGYFDPEANAFVAYQKLGRRILREGVAAAGLEGFIQHELAHWYQHNELKYARTSSVNVHRHRTWKEACYVATRNLWPEYKLELLQFSPETTVRRGGKPVKVQRPGSMTDPELHHWPHSLPALLERLAAEA
jgi:hypothetical protein